MEIEEKETEEEPKEEPEEEEKKEEENQEEKEDESEKTKGQEEVEETKPKTRMSFRLFKRKQTDKKAVKDEEKVVASEEPEGENNEVQEKVEKEEGAEEEEDKKETVNEDEKEDTQEQEVTNEPETEKTQEQEEMLEQASELNAKPKLRRSFNLFRKRPVSMSAADRSGTDRDEENVLSRDDPIRHSYHAGDLPVPDPSNLRKYLHTIFWVWSYLGERGSGSGAFWRRSRVKHGCHRSGNGQGKILQGQGKVLEFYLESGKIETEKSQGKLR